MAKRQSLREFQERLAGRLAQRDGGEPPAGLLGFEAGDERWLVPLSDAGEVVAVPQLAPVPLTRPWFAGIANLRGKLYAVTDLAAFRGGEPTPRNSAARLMLVGNRQGGNAALLVTRTLGLKNESLFAVPEDDESAPAWGRGFRADAEGRRWRLLDVPALIADPVFMQIGV